jgi:hypothetical protein
MTGAGHYEVLGVAWDAPPATVRRAYLELARRYHPDRPGGDAARMRLVNEAWAVVGDADRRAQYDLSLRTPPPAPPRSPAQDRWGRDPRYDPTDDLTEEELRAWHDGVDDPELRADLLDDRPLGPTIVLPQWAALFPPGVLASSILAFCLGVVLNLAAIVALSFVLLALAVLFFLAAPFVALLFARRSPGDPDHRSH